MSIVLGAKCLSYLKSIETHARAFLTLIILSIGTVKVKSPATAQLGEKKLKAHSYFPAPVLFQYFYEISKKIC